MQSIAFNYISRLGLQSKEVSPEGNLAPGGSGAPAAGVLEGKRVCGFPKTESYYKSCFQHLSLFPGFALPGELLLHFPDGFLGLRGVLRLAHL